MLSLRMRAAQRAQRREPAHSGRVHQRRPLLRAPSKGALREVDKLAACEALQLAHLGQLPQRDVLGHLEAQPELLRDRAVPVDGVLDDEDAARPLHRRGDGRRAPRQLVRLLGLELTRRGQPLEGLAAQAAALTLAVPSHDRRTAWLEPRYREGGARYALHRGLPVAVLCPA